MPDCEERLKSCTKRMDSQADDIKIIFATKASKSLFVLFFVVLLASYGYTFTVDSKVSNIVTRSDMEQYQMELIEAVKEAVHVE